MRYVEVGSARLSAVGLGTWQFGSFEWGYGRSYADNEAPRIVQRALDLGINLVDTAELYGFGRSERVVGKAIAGRRDDVFVATKLAPVVPFDPIVHRRAVASAGRLGVSSIDLYQAHWPNPVFSSPTPLFEAMRRLQTEGLVAHVGVSNYSLAQWRAAEDALGAPVLSNQVEYSLVKRSPEAELTGWASANGRVIIAYSPLAQGFLSGRYGPSHHPGGMRSMRPLFSPSNLERATELLDALRSVAASHDATPSQVSLAWLIHHPNVVVIPGASSVAQLESNAAAADLDLTDEEMRVLDDASAGFHPSGGIGVIPEMVRSHLPL